MSPSGGETTRCVASETHALEDIVSGPEKMEVELVHSNSAESIPSLGLSNLGNRRCKQGGYQAECRSAFGRMVEGFWRLGVSHSGFPSTTEDLHVNTSPAVVHFHCYQD